MTACVSCDVVAELPDGERCAECLPVIDVQVLPLRFGRALFDEVSDAGGVELRRPLAKLGKERHAVLENGVSACGKLPKAWTYEPEVTVKAPWCLDCVRIVGAREPDVSPAS